MGKPELVEALERAVGMSKAEAGRAIGGLVGIVGEALARGEKVNVAGLGVFRRVWARERVGRNPRTGEARRLGAHWRAKMKVSKELGWLVNGWTGTALRRPVRREDLAAHG